MLRHRFWNEQGGDALNHPPVLFCKSVCLLYKVLLIFIVICCDSELLSRTEKSFDWLKRRHYEWNTPGQDAN